MMDLLGGLGGMGGADNDALVESITKAMEKIAPKFNERDQKKIDELLKRTDLTREGLTLNVPEGMPLDVAILALVRQRDEEEKIQTLTFEFHMTVPEGALALYKTLQEIYNIVDLKSQMTIFGEDPPELVSVETEDDEILIPMGMLGVPGLEGHIRTSETWANGIPFFKLVAHVKGKHRSQILKIVETMRNRTDSIYKGKAIRLEFPDIGEGEATSKGDFFPEFLDLQSTHRDEVIFDDLTEEVLDVNLYTPIMKPDLCRKLGIDTKWGVMLYGSFGVGKTLTATVCAQLCRQYGRTFISCSIDDLTKAYAFASRHQPAFIFCEDLDQVLQESGTGTARSFKVNEILEALDGIESKGVEIITLLTTNNPEIVTKAMLRHGRINAAIELKAPDAKAVRRLIYHYAAGSLSEKENIDAICEQLAGKTASVVAAVVEKSRLSAVRHLVNDDDPLVITAHDLKVAFEGMSSHLKLLETQMPDKRSDIEKAATSAAALIAATLHPQPNGAGLPQSLRDKHATA